METPPILGDALLLTALTDPAMTDWNNNLLFDPARILVQLGGEGAINGPNNTFSLPLPQPILSICPPSGIEHFFSGPDPDGSGDLIQVDMSIKLISWCNDGSSDQRVQERLTFARDKRKFVFSQYGLYLRGAVHNTLRDYLIPEGLYVHDYVWEFYWSRSEG